jgi:hypothetical protein
VWDNFDPRLKKPVSDRSVITLSSDVNYRHFEISLNKMERAPADLRFDFDPNTPKAFANFSPGLELATTLGNHTTIFLNPVRVITAHA